MPNVCYIDGAFVPADAASVPAADLAVTRGYGVFDYLRTYGGRPFHLEAHLARLALSARRLELALPLPLTAIGDVVLEALARSEPGDHGVRIVITGGDSSDGLLPSGAARLLVLVTPPPQPPAVWFTDGVKITTHRAERYLPEAKTINYIPAILALRRAKAGGAVDSVYIDRDGLALEGTTTNLFAFFGDTLVTPARGILAGVTRQVTLELAESRYAVQQRDLPLAELLRADEVFITSSAKQVCPVRQIDDHVVGSPGPRTRDLMAAFEALVAQAARV
ncbi:MAG: aminotransferase class IV [Aggregatilineales bacterium]